MLTRSKPSPHRGQETITYLLQGGVDHEDFAGNRGTLGAGDLQFMTAGRGIVHAEMPRQNPDGSANVGLQLWVDLPRDLKACEPRYRDLRAAEIPAVDVDGGRATVKVISGRSHGIDSVKDLAYTPVWILDVELRPGARVSQPLPQGWNAFSYVLEGDVWFGEGDARTKVEQYHNVVFEQQGDVVHVGASASASKPARLGKPRLRLLPSLFRTQTLTRRLCSHRRRHPPGPRNRPVRALRPQLQGGRLPSPHGLPDPLQRLRARKGLEE